MHIMNQGTPIIFKIFYPSKPVGMMHNSNSNLQAISVAEEEWDEVGEITTKLGLLEIKTTCQNLYDFWCDKPCRGFMRGDIVQNTNTEQFFMWTDRWIPISMELTTAHHVTDNSSFFEGRIFS